MTKGSLRGLKTRGEAEDTCPSPPSYEPRTLAEELSSVVLSTLAERLRRPPAKPMGSPRVGSSPTGAVSCPASARPALTETN